MITRKGNLVVLGRNSLDTNDGVVKVKEYALKKPKKEIKDIPLCI